MQTPPHSQTMTMKLHVVLRVAAAFLLTLPLSNAYAPLAGITARSVKTLEDVDLSRFVSTPAAKGEKCMLVLGTYAADFNAIEYAQRYACNPSLRSNIILLRNLIIYLPCLYLG